jgi:S-disulfanyl-L-cysteine oxidoreductase SoxD
MTQGVPRRAARRSLIRPALGLATGLGMAVALNMLEPAPAAAQQAPPAARSVWDGVFTDLQADRGEREYGRTCAHCHGLALEGDGAREIPTLLSDPFMRHWRGRTVQALFDTLMRSMPADDRGSLTPRATADMIAYLLRINGVAAGQTPLPSDREALAALIIDEKPSGAPTP